MKASTARKMMGKVEDIQPFARTIVLHNLQTLLLAVNKTLMDYTCKDNDRQDVKLENNSKKSDHDSWSKVKTRFDQRIYTVSLSRAMGVTVHL
jgi:hypothetical protein